MKIMLLKSFLLVGAIMCFGLAKAQTVSGNVSDDNVQKSKGKAKNPLNGARQ